MAEQWLEEIYRQGDIIQKLHEAVWFLHSGNNREARAVYNSAAAHLEDLISEIATSDVEKAKRIQDAAICVMHVWDDPHDASGKLEAVLIPALFSYMSHFTDISVEENGYLLESADSGFLTVKDSKFGYYHDTHDPVYEAFVLAHQLYKPGMEDCRIFGVGMGYLPYMLWKISDESVRIHLYEEDTTILEYARHFGVLSRIDQDSIEVIHCDSAEATARMFMEDINLAGTSAGRFISPWKARSHSGFNNEEFTSFVLNDESKRNLRHIASINLIKNRSLKQVGFTDIKKRYVNKECVVAAAGPSFDDNITFIRESIGNRTIIAVNTVLRRLYKEQIHPDISVAADPYSQICDHMDGIRAFTSDIPLVADKLTYWKYCRDYEGEKCFIPSVACRSFEGAVSPGESIWNVGGTVSSMAIETAIRLGADTIYLIGLDLAYPAGVNYAEGMPHVRKTDTDVTMYVDSNDGRKVGTSEVFDIFRRFIEDQIAPYRNIRFINMSANGARIKGAEPYKQDR